VKRILCRILGVTLTVIEGLRFEGDSLVLGVRPWKVRERRCPVCGRRCPRYDAPRGPRRWRALDLCSTRCYLEYSPCRVRCPEHGVRVEAVPWADGTSSRFTRPFEEQVAWLCANCSTKTVSELMRVDWHTAGGVCDRVEARLRDAAGRSRLDGLRRIGIDETSYTRGHNYLTVVVDHDRGCVVWCARGHDGETLRSFFELLGRDRCAGVEVVTRDGARWIADVVGEFCPNAEQVMDPFHAVKWVTDALDEVRKRCCREAAAAHPRPRRRPGRPGRAEQPRRGPGRPPKVPPGEAGRWAGPAAGARFAVLKNPGDLTEGQARTLAAIERESPVLWRAYNLKERFRDVFRSPDLPTAEARLDAWLAWACRSKIPAMVEAQRKVRRRRAEVLRGGARHQQRARGGDQQQDQGNPAHGLRVQEHRQPHRARDAQVLRPRGGTAGEGDVTDPHIPAKARFS
jgi:transposase